MSEHTASKTLLAPRLVCHMPTNDPIECSLHTLPKPLMREFQHVFGENHLHFQSEAATPVSERTLLAIPTNQRAREDLVAVGDHIEREKDRLLNVFIDFGKDLCDKLRSMGYWADFIDPCSGLPMLTLHCNKVYSEVDGMECLLNYKSYNAGFCKILTHPKWGSSVYPATMFTHAPTGVVMQLLKNYPLAMETK